MSQRTTPLRPIATAHHPAGAGRGPGDRRHSRVTRARWSPSAPPRWEPTATAHVTTEAGMSQRTTPLEPKCYSAPPRRGPTEAPARGTRGGGARARRRAPAAVGGRGGAQTRMRRSGRVEGAPETPHARPHASRARLGGVGREELWNWSIFVIPCSDSTRIPTPSTQKRTATTNIYKTRRDRPRPPRPARCTPGPRSRPSLAPRPRPRSRRRRRRRGRGARARSGEAPARGHSAPPR